MADRCILIYKGNNTSFEALKTYLEALQITIFDSIPLKKMFLVGGSANEIKPLISDDWETSPYTTIPLPKPPTPRVKRW